MGHDEPEDVIIEKRFTTQQLVIPLNVSLKFERDGQMQLSITDGTNTLSHQMEFVDATYYPRNDTTGTFKYSRARCQGLSRGHFLVCPFYIRSRYLSMYEYDL